MKHVNENYNQELLVNLGVVYIKEEIHEELKMVDMVTPYGERVIASF